MCGICGYLHKGDIPNAVLKKMCDEIAYRGPDDKGYYYSSVLNEYNLGFAQRRLSIIDLSKKGHQPMLSDDGMVALVYNGEVYNFKEIRNRLQDKGYHFKTNTDTEVLLYSYIEWGIEAVKSFNGMFAFAIFDKRNNCVYLVRDRFGVKPLYYYHRGNDIAFASELKSLLKYPDFSKQIDYLALNLYLGMGYIQGEKTIYEKTHKVLPGEIVKWTPHGITKNKFWSVDMILEGNKQFNGSYEDAKDELKTLLHDSIRLRMISDVPLGAFLSNGIDSSLMAMKMQEVSSIPINTFTIGFPNSDYDESNGAEQVASFLGTNHNTLISDTYNQKEILEKIPYICDEPLADTSIISTYQVCKTTKEYVTVAISGDAGDELFCGYDRYSKHESYYNKYKKLGTFLQFANKFVPVQKGLIDISKNRNFDLLFHMNNTTEILLSSYLTFWDRHTKLTRNCLGVDYLKQQIIDCDNPVKSSMLFDLVSYMPDDILTKVDRASMSVSLETRAPLLDYRIVEFAILLPLQYTYYKGQQKRILKDILFENIPSNLIPQKKRGFGVPVSDWLKKDFNTLTRGLFSKEYLKQQGIFDVAEVSRIINSFKSTLSTISTKEVWTLLIFQLWYDYYIK